MTMPEILIGFGIVLLGVGVFLAATVDERRMSQWERETSDRMAREN
jgi:hypothetical protein